MILFFVLVVSFFAQGFSANKIVLGGPICQQLLRRVHVELAITNSKDQATQRPLSQLSRKGAIESAALHRNPPVIGHALSLGSGPDIFRLLQDFPLIPNLHLVDILTGQSAPGKVIREIEQRLKAIGSVELVNPGFVEDFSWLILDDHKLAHNRFVEQYYAMRDNPRIWRLNWTSTILGKREALIHLHLRDFDNSYHIKDLVVSFANSGGLMGVLMTGTSLQSKESIKILMEHLGPGASIAYEVFYNLDGSLQKIVAEDTTMQDFFDVVAVRTDFIQEVLKPQANEGGAFNNYSRMHILTKAIR